MLLLAMAQIDHANPIVTVVLHMLLPRYVLINGNCSSFYYLNIPTHITFQFSKHDNTVIEIKSMKILKLASHQNKSLGCILNFNNKTSLDL